MMSLLRAAAIIILLVVMAFLLARTGQEPVPVTLNIGTITLTTTAPVAITLSILSLLLAFYAGQLGSWLARLPGIFGNLVNARRRQSTEETLTQAWAAWLAGDEGIARKLASGLVPPVGPLSRLATLLHLNLGQLSAAQADTAMADPALTLPVGLHMARAAAAKGDWPTVLAITTRLRGSADKHPAVNVLHFKALLNTADPDTAAFIPQLKSLLGPTRTKLLTTVVQGPTAVNARPTLDNPWVKALRDWLPTASETFPDAPAK